MKRVFVKFIFCSIALLPSNYCVADEIKYPIDLSEEKCLNTAYSTADMRKCTYDAMDSWFKEIDKYMALLRKELPKEKLNTLETSQKHWKEYQLVEFDLINELIHNKGGTVYTVVAIAHKLNIIKERALNLQKYYKEIKDSYL